MSGRTFSHDIYLYINEPRIRKRDKSHSKRIQGHKELSCWERKNLLKEEPELLIIGMGQSGVLPMTEKTQLWLKEVTEERKIEVIKGLTPEVFEKTNLALTSGKRVIGIFHTTC